MNEVQIKFDPHGRSYSYFADAKVGDVVYIKNRYNLNGAYLPVISTEKTGKATKEVDGVFVNKGLTKTKKRLRHRLKQFLLG